MQLHTVTQLAQTSTGRALLEHAHFLERRANSLAEIGARDAEAERAIYAAFARWARAAFRQLPQSGTAHDAAPAA